MVKVFAAHLRDGQNGKFVSLELHGELEMVQSMTTARFYATSRKTFVSTTFDLETAKGFVGQQIKGSIARVETEPYDFTIPQTGEVIQLAHSWVYLPDEGAIPAPQLVEA
jgi:hypothetical protein